MTQTSTLEIVVSSANKAHHQDYENEIKGAFSPDSIEIIRKNLKNRNMTDSCKIFS